MKVHEQQEQIEGAIERAVQAVDVMLWGVDICLVRKTWQITVYIDHASGVSADICAIAAKQVAVVLGAEGLGRENFQLEVSSPGVDRTLFSVAQCALYLQHHVACFLGKGNKVKGTLVAADGEKISIAIAHKSIADITFSDIDKINLVEEHANG